MAGTTVARPETAFSLHSLYALQLNREVAASVNSGHFLSIVSLRSIA